MYNDGRNAAPVYIYYVRLSVCMSVSRSLSSPFPVQKYRRSSSSITDLWHYPSIHKLWNGCSLLAFLAKPLKILSLFHCKMFSSWIFRTSFRCKVCFCVWDCKCNPCASHRYIQCDLKLLFAKLFRTIRFSFALANATHFPHLFTRLFINLLPISCHSVSHTWYFLAYSSCGQAWVFVCNPKKKRQEQKLVPTHLRTYLSFCCCYCHIGPRKKTKFTERDRILWTFFKAMTIWLIGVHWMFMKMMEGETRMKSFESECGGHDGCFTTLSIWQLFYLFSLPRITRVQHIPIWCARKQTAYAWKYDP